MGPVTTDLEVGLYRDGQGGGHLGCRVRMAGSQEVGGGIKPSLVQGAPEVHGGSERSMHKEGEEDSRSRVVENPEPGVLRTRPGSNGGGRSSKPM